MQKPDLTDRQLEILLLVHEGLTFDEMGERLSISPRTAKAHTNTLRQKLGVTKKRLLSAKARELGLIPS